MRQKVGWAWLVGSIFFALGLQSCIKEEGFEEIRKDGSPEAFLEREEEKRKEASSREDGGFEGEPSEERRRFEDVLVEEPSKGLPPCFFEARETRLSFHHVPAGQSRSLLVSLKNKGGEACQIQSDTPLRVEQTSPSFGPSAFSIPSFSYPMTILANEEWGVSVTFTPPPRSQGFEGMLFVPSPSPSHPTLAIRLAGYADNTCLTAIPLGFEFGTTTIGCASSLKTVALFRPKEQGCAAPITITSIRFAHATPSAFRLRKLPTLPFRLAADEFFEIAVSFHPSKEGVVTGSLEIETSAIGHSPFVVPLAGEGVFEDTQTDVFQQSPRPKTDVLLVIDNSSTMAEEQKLLADQFEVFFDQLLRTSLDLHLMVVTTDTIGSNLERGCGRRGAGSSTAIVDRSTPNPLQTLLSNANVGTRGSSTEAGFEAAYLALTPPRIFSCNQGFLRKDAALSVYFVSDEDDQSPESVEWYVQFFQGLKGSRENDRVTLHSVVGPAPSGCRNPGLADAAPAPRYIQAGKDSRGISAPICSPTWFQYFVSLDVIPYFFRTQFFLTRPPDPLTLSVRVAQTLVPQDPNSGWSYDSVSNSILFSFPATPFLGTTFRVDYKVVCRP